jgi:hypothetical protein
MNCVLFYGFISASRADTTASENDGSDSRNDHIGTDTERSGSESYRVDDDETVVLHLGLYIQDILASWFLLRGGAKNNPITIGSAEHHLCGIYSKSSSPGHPRTSSAK